MRDTLQLLSNNPEIGITTTLGSGMLHWLGVINPILSFICMLISATGGIYWILLKHREYKKG